ncbi:MAG: lamin tail domain-containing protein [Ginsengibacter sp.]
MKNFLTILLFTIPVSFCIGQSKTIVISEIYGGAGNTGSSYNKDYLQLFNLSSSQVDLTGYTLQIGDGGGSTQTFQLSGTILPFHWFLVQGNSDGAAGADLPIADVISDFNLDMHNGTVALVHSVTSIGGTCNSSGEDIVDFVGYGNNTNCFETAVAPGQAIDLATSRKNFAADANNNFADFTVFPPNPKNGSVLALPVTLNTFLASKQSTLNKIHWQVNCLSTSVTFTVERSGTLQDFNGIYTSTEAQARCASPFDFTDSRPLNGENYYRLKIADVDGHITYSKISVVSNTEIKKDILQIIPNTVSSAANIHYFANQPGKVQLMVVDVQGKIVKQITLRANAGNNKITLQTENFTKGLYHVGLFSNNEKIAASKFMKR